MRFRYGMVALSWFVLLFGAGSSPVDAGMAEFQRTFFPLVESRHVAAKGVAWGHYGETQNAGIDHDGYWLNWGWTGETRMLSRYDEAWNMGRGLKRGDNPDLLIVGNECDLESQCNLPVRSHVKLVLHAQESTNAGLIVGNFSQLATSERVEAFVVSCIENPNCDTRRWVAFGVHMYTENPNDVTAQIDEIAGILDRHNLGHLPIWYTEIGSCGDYDTALAVFNRALFDSRVERVYVFSPFTTECMSLLKPDFETFTVVGMAWQNAGVSTQNYWRNNE